MTIDIVVVAVADADMPLTDALIRFCQFDWMNNDILYISICCLSCVLGSPLLCLFERTAVNYSISLWMSVRTWMLRCLSFEHWGMERETLLLICSNSPIWPEDLPLHFHCLIQHAKREFIKSCYEWHGRLTYWISHVWFSWKWMQIHEMKWFKFDYNAAKGSSLTICF